MVSLIENITPASDLRGFHFNQLSGLVHDHQFAELLEIEAVRITEKRRRSRSFKLADQRVQILHHALGDPLVERAEDALLSDVASTHGPSVFEESHD